MTANTGMEVLSDGRTCGSDARAVAVSEECEQLRPRVSLTESECRSAGPQRDIAPLISDRFPWGAGPRMSWSIGGDVVRRGPGTCRVWPPGQKTRAGCPGPGPRPRHSPPHDHDGGHVRVVKSWPFAQPGHGGQGVDSHVDDQLGPDDGLHSASTRSKAGPTKTHSAVSSSRSPSPSGTRPR
jgi:hypothetical protein